MPGASLTAERLRAMFRLAPGALPPASPMQAPQVHKAEGTRRGRVALLTGCAQQVLAPSINEATIRLLTRMGIEVVITREQGCCGALNHHMGDHDAGHGPGPGQYRRLERARPRARGWMPWSSIPPAAAPR